MRPDYYGCTAHHLPATGKIEAIEHRLVRPDGNRALRYLGPRSGPTRNGEGLDRIAHIGVTDGKGLEIDVAQIS